MDIYKDRIPSATPLQRKNAEVKEGAEKAKAAGLTGGATAYFDRVDAERIALLGPTPDEEADPDHISDLYTAVRKGIEAQTLPKREAVGSMWPPVTVEPVDDPVSKPAHYRAGGIECIDAIRSALGDDGFGAYCRAAIIKYAWRSPHKGTAAQDLRKAAQYAHFAANVLDGKAPLDGAR